MNTQGVGIRPDEGAMQPKGTRSYHRPLCARRDGERVDPQGMTPIPSDGY